MKQSEAELELSELRHEFGVEHRLYLQCQHDLAEAIANSRRTNTRRAVSMDGFGLAACNGERDMSNETTETSELREIATLAYRALEDAYRVISTIDGDDTHEQWELDLLTKRVKDAASSLFVVLRYPKVGADDTALERPNA